MKHKGITAINILSLSIGMAACLVIFLFVTDELSFDSFHEKKQQIYRLCEVQSFEGTNTQNVALSMPGMGPTMTAEFQEIEAYTRFWGLGERMMADGDHSILVENIAAVDSSFLEIFDYQLIHGDPGLVLDRPYDAVISEDIAQALFNRIDVVGESVVIGGDQYIVRGVMANVPENSHLKFNVLLNVRSIADNPDFDSEFGSNYLVTYFVLRSDANLANMAELYPDYLIRSTGEEDINDAYKLFLQPLDQVHLNSIDIEHDYNNYRKFNGTYIQVFILVGLFIIVIASFNFMNLTVARASGRAKEIGVRKTNGAIKQQLFTQFIIESTFLAFIAFIVGLLIALLALPLLNALIDRQLSLSPILTDPLLIGTLVATTILLGVLAGLYPSFYLSSFKPIAVLKGIKAFGQHSFLGNSMVVIQFSLALAIIVSTLVVVQQLNFLKNKDIGFNKDHIILVGLNEEAMENYAEMKLALLKESNVLGVTASGQRIGSNFHQWGFKIKKEGSEAEVITTSNVSVDHDYLEVYGIELLEGRGFSKEYVTDDGLAFIINESLARELGLDQPIGVNAGHSWYPDDSLGTIIGVTKDFNFNSLHFPVNTLSMVVHTDWGFSEMSVKLNGANIGQSLLDLERVYGQFVSKYPFDYQFLDDHFQNLYQTDQQMGYVIAIMAVLSIFIGCLGLFGLASIATERRIKEVGIRKVLGASTLGLMALLSRNFARLVLISLVFATPMAFLFLKNWLTNFAYRVDINPLIFIVGGMVALVIALITISYHVVKATNSNPVKALKYE